MSILSPGRTAALQAIAEQGFVPDHAAFLARLATGRRRDRENAAVARAHLHAFSDRVRRALEALDAGNLGAARAYLEIGQRDYTAAIHALPQ